MLSRARIFRGGRLWRPALLSPALGRQLAWVVAPFGTTQFLRLLTNIGLTRLLAPEVFGIMLLINSLRTGTELLSDIGIGQSVVRSPHGEERRFLDVAWTLQLLRGALLSLAAMLAAFPVAQLYGRPDIAPMILAVSPVFLLTGLQSPALFVAQRRMELRRRAIYDIASTVLNSLFAIALALVMPTVWALVIALVMGAAMQTALTYIAFGRQLPRLAWDPRFVHEIVGFGKWIFLSTAIYFAATSYDRLYFVAALPLAMAGIYGVARTFSDMLGSLVQRAGALLVFPRAAAMRGDDPDASRRLRATRRKTLAMVALATGAGIAGADQFILLAYDERYHAAAFMIPILLASVWFGMLSSFADSMLMGRGRPAPGAMANAVKFLTLLIGLPLAIAHGSLLEALLVLVAAEAARWLALAVPSHRAGFARLVDDLGLTLLTLGFALACKLVGGWLGVVPTVGEWWAMRGLLHG